jgi:ribosomal protein L18
MSRKRIMLKRLSRKNRSQYRLRKINRDSGKLRLSVFCSRQHIIAQLIDDTKSITVQQFSTNCKEFMEIKTSEQKSYNVAGAIIAGQIMGKKINDFSLQDDIDYKGLYIDRCGKNYIKKGRLASFCDEVRLAVKKWSF